MSGAWWASQILRVVGIEHVASVALAFNCGWWLYMHESENV